MRMSKLFTKTRKEAPKDEVSKNAQLLIRAGYIHKEMAGVYSYLPLGLRVLKKIENIIREEMDAIGGQEMLMTTLQDPELWKKTNRWDDEVVDNWFKSKMVNGTEVGIANTHEEPLTQLLTHFADSHKDFPLYAYQFQTKFRNELRAKSGIMRVREFLMKDLYSFSKTDAEFQEFYEKCAKAYSKIFDRVGIGHVTFRTKADGGSFTDQLTDEFQTVSDAGEDTIYVDETKKIAVNKEVYTDETLEKLSLDKNDLVEKKAIEVGNIFPLGTKYSEQIGLTYSDEKGERHPVTMGSYGIGLGRLMGTIVEVLSDERGIVWPESIAPYTVALVALDGGHEEASKLYEELAAHGDEVLFDDRDDTAAGEKFADADLLGIPTRVVVSKRSLEKDSAEIKKRGEKQENLVLLSDLSSQL